MAEKKSFVWAQEYVQAWVKQEEHDASLSKSKPAKTSLDSNKCSTELTGGELKAVKFHQVEHILPFFHDHAYSTVL